MKKDKIENFNITVLDDKTKQAKEVEVSASSFEQARLQAMSSGNVIEVKRKKSFFSKVKLSQFQRIDLMNDLATMLNSKVGTTTALKKIEESYSGVVEKVARLLRNRVEAGSDLPTAMESLGPNAFPDNIVALVKAGSLGGSTGKALEEATDFERELSELKKESGKGLFGAIAGFLSAGIFILGGIFYLTPKIQNSPLFEANPVDTTFIDNLSIGIAVVIAIIMFFAFILISLNTYIKMITPLFADKLIMKIPFYKDIVLAKNAYTTFFGLSKLLGSGVSVENSLKISMENTKKGVLKSDLNKAYKALRRGDVDWPLQMKSLRPTDKSCLLVSTNREHSAEVLRNISKLYRRRYGDRLGVLVPTLQLVSALLLVIIGAIMSSQFMGMLDIMNGMT